MIPVFWAVCRGSIHSVRIAASNANIAHIHTTTCPRLSTRNLIITVDAHEDEEHETRPCSYRKGLQLRYGYDLAAR